MFFECPLNNYNRWCHIGTWLLEHFTCGHYMASVLMDGDIVSSVMPPASEAQQKRGYSGSITDEHLKWQSKENPHRFHLHRHATSTWLVPDLALFSMDWVRLRQTDRERQRMWASKSYNMISTTHKHWHQLLIEHWEEITVALRRTDMQ